jgi:hypothetical protein
MKLITESLTEKLLANGRAQRAAIDNDQPALDFKPVVKLFTPDAQCTWLLTELDPDGGLAFGLCDLGLGCPELGYVSLAELSTVRGKLGLPSSAIATFSPTKPFPPTPTKLALTRTSSPKAILAPHRRRPISILMDCSHSRRPPTQRSAQRGCISSSVEHNMVGS